MTQFSIERWPVGDTTIEASWNRLVDRGRFNATLGPGWFAVIAGKLAPRNRPIAILVRRECDPTISAAVPFFTSSCRMLGVPMTVLEAGSNMMSYHAEIIADGNPEPVLRALLGVAPKWDVLRLANVPLESGTAKAVAGIARAMGATLQVIPGDNSPYLAIDRPWDDYLASRGKKFRYKVRHRRELIERDASCELRWIADESAVEELLRDILIVEQHSWKSTAGLEIAAGETELEYHRSLLPFLARERALIANVLLRSGQPIAYSLCCSFGGWIGHLKTSFNQDHSELSPGAFLIDRCVQKAFECGAREFDFLGDAAPHKLAWTSTTRPHGDFFMFAPRMKGRVVGWLKTRKSRLNPTGSANADSHDD